ncbi:hypothetical protein cypCar_00027971, partial [Cyprinus carpio]
MDEGIFSPLEMEILSAVIEVRLHYRNFTSKIGLFCVTNLRTCCEICVGKGFAQSHEFLLKSKYKLKNVKI